MLCRSRKSRTAFSKWWLPSFVPFLCSTVFSADPRIVSTSPAATELLFALGRGASVVGTPEWSDFPADAKKIERIGPLTFPGPERMLRLRPDLVLFDVTNPLPDVERAIARRRVATKTLSIRSVPELFQTANDLLRDLFRSPLPKELLSLRQRWSERTAEGTTPFLVLASADPPIAASGKTFLADVLQRLGGKNLCPDLGSPYPELSADWLVAAKPKVVFVLRWGDRLLPNAEAALRRYFPSQPRIIELPSDRWGRPTFTALSAAEALENPFGLAR